MPTIARDLARRLLDYEATAGETSVPAQSATLRVYEKLRIYLCALAGVAGFQSLASRALTLAKLEVPNLSSLQITADGFLQGLEPPFDNDQSEDGGVILIAHLIALLHVFIGETLTISLLQDIWWSEPAFERHFFNSGEQREA